METSELPWQPSAAFPPSQSVFGEFQRNFLHGTQCPKPYWLFSILLIAIITFTSLDASPADYAQEGRVPSRPVGSGSTLSGKRMISGFPPSVGTSGARPTGRRLACPVVSSRNA